MEKAPNIDEILRYLGIKGNKNEEIEELILSCVKELEKTASPKSLYDICDVKTEGDIVYISSLKVESRDLARNLETCDKAVLFAATLGFETDRLIEKYALIDVARAAVLQACAAEMIERYIDSCEEEIKKQVDSYYLIPRYSPGYGDFSIKYQSEFLDLFNAKKILGITLTQTGFMLPAKTVTAIIGLSKEKLEIKGCISNCVLCRKTDCPYRRD